MTPQLLIVGHIVKDLTPTGWVAGGGALYAAAQAQKLGLDTVIVTACDAVVDPAALVPGVQWRVLPVPECTRFENTYAAGHRTQRVYPVDRPISLSDVPEDWRRAPLVLLTPVFHDVDPALPALLKTDDNLVGLGAQGWLRRQENGKVLPGSSNGDLAWLAGDAVFVSEEDVSDPEAIAAWQNRVRTVVLTRGSAGYTVWDGRGRHEIAAEPACERDPTGAGDIFATAYLTRYQETSDALASARFAAAAAAHSVEGAGIEAVGDRAAIEARLARHGARA
jgi:sugar/nucleoside kinase (ribokinase family)